MSSRANLWSLAAAAIVFLGLAPAIVGHYGYTDDYSLLYQALTDPAEIDRTFLGAGRPLGGPLYRWLFTGAGSIAGLSGIRFLCAVAEAVLAFSMTKLALRYGYRPALAFLLGAILVTLPSTLVSGTWATQIIGPMTAVLSLWAGAILVGARERFLRSVAIGMLLLTACVCLYQPAAMMFWVTWLLWVLSPSTRATPVKEVLRATGGFLIAMALASVAGLVVHRLGAAAAHWTGRTGLATDVFAKLSHLVTNVWPGVADPWRHGVSGVRGIVLAVMTIVGMLLLPPVERSRRLLRLEAVFAVLVLGYAPNLASSETWVTSRSMVALLPVLPLCLVSLLQDVADRFQPRETLFPPIAVAVAVLGAAWSASFVYANVAVPQERELEFIRPAVLEATKAPSLAVLPSSWAESFVSRVESDEIGLPSTSQTWAVVPMTELLYREAHGTWYGQAHLRLRKDKSPITEAAVLDFAVLLDPRKERAAPPPEVGEGAQ